MQTILGRGETVAGEVTLGRRWRDLTGARGHQGATKQRDRDRDEGQLEVRDSLTSGGGVEGPCPKACEVWRGAARCGRGAAR